MIPYTDRLNYCSSFINNVGYCRTVEQMLGIEVPPQGGLGAAPILSEFSRIMDHCVCNGTTLVDVGALTNFWYMFQPREEIYGLLESCCGARLTVSACRIGGLVHDLPPDFMQRSRTLLEMIPPFVEDVEKLVDKNRIWLDRSVGVAAISGAEAVNWGWTGPCLRASGVSYDVRRAHPYDLYDTLDWEVPVAPRRRRLRPLPRPHDGDPPVAQDHPPAPRPRHARGPAHRRTIRTWPCRPRTPPTTRWKP